MSPSKADVPVQKIAAFSDGATGGNPAGVVVGAALPAEPIMRRVAAAAALGGYLRDIRWPHGKAIEIVQGEDMGMRSRIRAEISPVVGESIRVSGTARVLPA